MKGAAGEGFATVNSLFKPATLGFGSKLGDETGRVERGSTQYGTKEEVEWKQKFIRSSVESATDMVVTPIVMKSVGTGIRILDKKINYSNLTYGEYKFLKEYKYKPISEEITSKYKDIRTYRYNSIIPLHYESNYFLSKIDCKEKWNNIFILEGHLKYLFTNLRIIRHY